MTHPETSETRAETARGQLIAAYLRARFVIAAVGSVAALGLGSLNGWPRGPWIAIIAVSVLTHAQWTRTRGSQITSVLIIDAVVVAGATALTGRQLVTLAALTMILVAAAILEQGNRAFLVWAGVLALFGLGQYTRRFLPDEFHVYPNRALTEAVGVAFFVASTVGLVRHVAPELRRADRAQQSAKAELEARRRRFETLLRYNPGGLAVTDANLKIVDVGVQNERITGAATAERVGRSALELVVPEDRSIVVDAYKRVMTDASEPVHMQVRTPLPGGGVRVMSAWLRNLTEDPDVRGLVFNFEDITAGADDLAHSDLANRPGGLETAVRPTGLRSDAASDEEPRGRTAAG